MAHETPGAEFVDLLVRHQHDLRRFVRSLGVRGADVDEVLQQTTAGVWEKRAEFDTARAFFPWAAKFAYLEVLKLRERRAADRLVFSEETIRAIATRAQADASLYEAKLDALRGCLQRLGRRDRDLLHAKYGLGRAAADLAEQQGCTPKAVYRRLDRVRGLLAECLRRRIAQADR